MQADPLTPFWDDDALGPNRWDRLREIFEKLRLVADAPVMRPGGVDGLLDQLEMRLAEAAELFPEEDWLLVGGEGGDAVERQCGSHVGALLGVLLGVMAALDRERAGEMTGDAENKA